MSKRLAMLIAAVVVIALTVAGCGSTGSSVTTAQITKAAFLKKVDATCAKIYDQVRSGYQSFVESAQPGPFSSLSKIRRFAETVLIPAKRQEVEELRKLGAPAGDGEQIEAILGAYEEGIATAEEDPRAAVTSTFGVFTEATELAEEYGLKDCRY